MLTRRRRIGATPLADQRKPAKCIRHHGDPLACHIHTATGAGQEGLPIRYANSLLGGLVSGGVPLRMSYTPSNKFCNFPFCAV